MGEDIQIRILDSVDCRAIGKKSIEAIKPLLKYKMAKRRNIKIYTPRGVRTISEEYFIDKSMINSQGYFLAGLLPRIRKHFRIKDINTSITGSFERIRPDISSPKLKGITFRNDQLDAIHRTVGKQRGRIIHPTGSGKTIIFLGLLSMYRSKKSLILCHTKDLLNQIEADLKKYNFPCFVNGDGKKVDFSKIAKRKDGCVVVSTIHSMTSAKYQDMPILFDIVIVDEAHHVNSSNSMYGKFLRTILPPMKIGFTATLPSKEHEDLFNEGIFGPVLAELTVDEATELKITAKPKVLLQVVPYNVNINQKAGRLYQNFYKYGLVENEERNKIILSIAMKAIDKGKSSLIIIDKLDHGKILQKLFSKKGINCPFVQGLESSDFRNEVKKNLSDKKQLTAICTKVWKEGINIPSLDFIIYAAGGKEEKSVKQAMGRGLRRTETKYQITLIDFLDPFKYLAEHSIARYTVYHKLGWIKN